MGQYSYSTIISISDLVNNLLQGKLVNLSNPLFQIKIHTQEKTTLVWNITTLPQSASTLMKKNAQHIEKKNCLL